MEGANDGLIHGTRSSYAQGCRCGSCREAARIYTRRYRAGLITNDRGDLPRGPTTPMFERPDWQSQAACRGVDPALFFPERGEPTEPIKAICRGCPVRDDCLDWALAAGERFGIWGGHSERERQRMRRAS